MLEPMSGAARRPVITLLVAGRLEKHQSATRQAEDCRVFIPDHHVGYIDWATYEENRRMTRRNSVNRQGDESMAAIRDGQGLPGGTPSLWALWPQARRMLPGEAAAPT